MGEAEFDLDKVYIKIRTKKEIIEFIEKSLDNEFMVVFLPRSKNNADILIRSLKEKSGGEEND